MSRRFAQKKARDTPLPSSVRASRMTAHSLKRGKGRRVKRSDGVSQGGPSSAKAASLGMAIPVESAHHIVGSGSNRGAFTDKSAQASRSF